MVARVSGTLFEGPLRSVIGNMSNNPINSFALYKGELPTSLSDTLNAANMLSSNLVGGSASAVSIPYTSCWAFPSSGVTILTSPIAIPIRGTGLPTTPVPGFLRFYMANTPVMDIEVSTVNSSQVAKLSTVSAVTAGQVISLMDLRFRIATSGPMSFSNSFASAILRSMTAQSQYFATTEAGNVGYYAGLPFTSNFSRTTGAEVITAANIIASAYDGPIPESANAQATGTKLWEKSYGSVSGSNIWTVSGNTMGLLHTFTANALASGTPTYIRVVKNAITSNPYIYPKMTLQLEVDSGVNFYNKNMVVGVSNTLDMFGFYMIPM